MKRYAELQNAGAKPTNVVERSSGPVEIGNSISGHGPQMLGTWVASSGNVVRSETNVLRDRYGLGAHFRVPAASAGVVSCGSGRISILRMNSSEPSD